MKVTDYGPGPGGMSRKPAPPPNRFKNKDARALRQEFQGDVQWMIKNYEAGNLGWVLGRLRDLDKKLGELTGTAPKSA